jgi:pyruvate/2-oxoglutarate dehydrogenase complex dihydrolipoamide dehydrogenase (E3) component
VSEQTDVIVLGLGIAGELVAGDLAEAGLAVTGIDAALVGGECPYWGCIPSKMMIRAANLLAEARRIPGMSGDVAVSPRWGEVAARIRDEATDDWDDQVAVERFEGKGGRFVRGAGRLVAPDAVEVSGRRFEARRGIVLATGTEPAIPPVPGLDTVAYWTNRDAVRVKELPASIVVMGGGAIGTELTQVFARFGVAVTIVEALPRLLPNEEPEAGDLVADILRREGVTVHTGARAARVAGAGDAIAVQLEGGPELMTERLLVATGRRADLGAIGVAAAGLDADARWVQVDARMRARDGIWAVGDVTGAGLFTHMAVHQARIARDDLLGREPDQAPHPIPRVTFTDPEIGSVGLTEAAARSAGHVVRVGSAQLPSSARGWLHKAGNDGFVKLVEDTRDGVLVGATVAGPSGGEVLGMLTLAVDQRIPTAALRRMIYAYPTFSRAVEDALRDLS